MICFRRSAHKNRALRFFVTGVLSIAGYDVSVGVLADFNLDPVRYMVVEIIRNLC